MLDSYIVIDTESRKGKFSINWNHAGEVCAIYVEGGSLKRELHWDQMKCSAESTGRIKEEWTEFSKGAEVVWCYATNRCDYIRMSCLLGEPSLIPWQDASTTIARHIITTDFTATDKPYARSRKLKHINEAMLFENETPLVEGNMNLGSNPPKVRKDVEILWRLILLAKYIVEKGAGAGNEVKVGLVLPYDEEGWAEAVEQTIRWRLDSYTKAGYAPGVEFQLVTRNVDDWTQARALIKTFELVYDEKVNALIGASTSVLTSVVGLVAAEKRIPLCDGSSSAVGLSDKNVYPTFFRTTTNDAVDAVVLADFLQAQGWRQVAMLAAANTYGLDLSQDLINEVSKRGISVLLVTLFRPGQPESEWRKHISAMKASGATIFVAMGSGTELLDATAEALKQGLFEKEYAWITTGYAMDWEWYGFNVTDLTLRDGMFMPFPDERPDPALYQEFVDGWLAADKTLYPLSSEPPADTVELPMYCADLFLEGWKQLVDGNASISWADIASNKLTSEYVYLCPNVTDSTCVPTFVRNAGRSVAGNMSFDFTTGERLPNYYIWHQLKDGVFSTNVVGEWLRGNTSLWTDKIVYLGNSTVRPFDRHISYISYQTEGAFGVAAIAGALSIVTVGVVILYYVYRNESYIKASSVLFCELILLGILLGYASVFTFIGTPEAPGLCLGQVWSLGMAFILIFGNLATKTGRIWVIFHRTETGTSINTGITNAQLLRPAGLLIGIQVLILALWTGIDPPHPRIDFTRAAKYCQSDGYVFTGLIIAYDALVVFAGVVFAVRTRAVAARFSDSAGIGLSVITSQAKAWFQLQTTNTRIQRKIYTITLVLCVLVPMFILVPSPIMSWGALIACIIVSLNAVLTFLFLPKVYALYNHKLRGIDPDIKPETPFGAINDLLQAGSAGSTSVAKSTKSKKADEESANWGAVVPVPNVVSAKSAECNSQL
ncbi:hypothetical protein HK104_003790 [Borealophlyctis nickersoniae]|nr:hypothetical protein HK104_003790 [Borealophlyctis nickersoniae]